MKQHILGVWKLLVHYEYKLIFNIFFKFYLKNIMCPSLHHVQKLSQCGSWVLNRFNRVWLFVTLWAVAHQAPLSMGFSKQEYWRGLHFLLQRIFLTQGLSLCLECLLHWQEGSWPLAPPGKPSVDHRPKSKVTKIYIYVFFWKRP